MKIAIWGYDLLVWPIPTQTYALQFTMKLEIHRRTPAKWIVYDFLLSSTWSNFATITQPTKCYHWVSVFVVPSLNEMLAFWRNTSRKPECLYISYINLHVCLCTCICTSCICMQCNACDASNACMYVCTYVRMVCYVCVWYVMYVMHVMYGMYGRYGMYVIYFMYCNVMTCNVM